MWTVLSLLARILIAAIGAMLTFVAVLMAVMLTVITIHGVERYDHNAGAGFAVFVLGMSIAGPASLLAFGLLLAFTPSGIPTGQKPGANKQDL